MLKIQAKNILTDGSSRDRKVHLALLMPVNKIILALHIKWLTT